MSNFKFPGLSYFLNSKLPQSCRDANIYGDFMGEPQARARAISLSQEDEMSWRPCSASRTAHTRRRNGATAQDWENAGRGCHTLFLLNSCWCAMAPWGYPPMQGLCCHWKGHLDIGGQLRTAHGIRRMFRGCRDYKPPGSRQEHHTFQGSVWICSSALVLP